jgi:hypothetical protein
MLLREREGPAGEISRRSLFASSARKVLLFKERFIVRSSRRCEILEGLF